MYQEYNAPPINAMEPGIVKNRLISVVIKGAKDCIKESELSIISTFLYEEAYTTYVSSAQVSV